MAETRIAQRETTRARLIAIARRRFGTQGFAGTSTEQILRDADLGRGALYYHFADKADLFLAAYKEMGAEVDAAIERAVGDAPPGQRIGAAFRTYLALAAGAPFRQIVVRDAAAVLNQDAREAADGFGLAGLRRALHEGVDTGELRPDLQVGPTARLLRATLNEIAILLTSSPTRADAGAEMERTVLDFVAGLSPDRRDTRAMPAAHGEAGP